MSILKKKSEENLQAIDILINSNLKSPVIHCAYYSSLQLLIHFFYQYTGVTPSDVQKETINGGSHNYFLSKSVIELKRINPENASIFYKYFSTFKRKRTDADYSDIDITDLDLVHAREMAIRIKEFFKRVENEGKCQNVHTIEIN